MPVRSVPGAASNAQAAENGKLFAPSAARNFAPICDLLQSCAPPEGSALEIASGTGQHIIGFATAFPNLTWQPSEVDEGRRRSIDAYVADSATANIRPALLMDATAPGWSKGVAPQDLILLSNLLHLVSEKEAHCLITEAAAALNPGGRFVIYGPFKRDGELTSSGDRSFHDSLTSHDPEIGYKDTSSILDWAAAQGLTSLQVAEMPANNLALVFAKPGALT